MSEKWQDVGSGLTRILVPGGWLYESRTGGLAFVPNDSDIFKLDSVGITKAVKKIIAEMHEKDAA